MPRDADSGVARVHEMAKSSLGDLSDGENDWESV